MKNKNIYIYAVLFVSILCFFASLNHVLQSKRTVWDELDEASTVMVEYYKSDKSIEIINIDESAIFVATSEYAGLIKTNQPVGQWIIRLTYNPSNSDSNKKTYVVEIGENSFSVNGKLYTTKEVNTYKALLIRLELVAKKCGFDVEIDSYQ